MTPQAQQRAIAIACGKTPSCAPDPYVDTPDFHEWLEWKTQEHLQIRFRKCSKCPALHIEGERYVSIPDDHAVPDYLHDLDAIHEAVMALQSNVRDLMNLKLCEITAGNFDCSETHDMDAALNATAAQRAEAFLKTLGLWVEETESQPC